MNPNTNTRLHINLYPASSVMRASLQPGDISIPESIRQPKALPGRHHRSHLHRRHEWGYLHAAWSPSNILNYHHDGHALGSTPPRPVFHGRNGLQLHFLTVHPGGHGLRCWWATTSVAKCHGQCSPHAPTRSAGQRWFSYSTLVMWGRRLSTWIRKVSITASRT